MTSNKLIPIVLLTAIISVGATYLIMQNSTPETPSETSKSICMDYDNDNMSTLDADLVHTMTGDYKTNQLNYIETATGTKAPKDAYSIWFDLETLKKFLYHIETISKKNENTIAKEDLGVRIYYASYPNKEIMKNFPDLDVSRGNPAIVNYNGLHTLVMIPTLLRDGVDVDFNPLDEATYTNGLSKIEKYGLNHPSSIPNNTAALVGTSTTSRDTSARNHGILCPPGVTTGFGF